MKPGERRPVTVEDLLRLKQREVPAEEFWAQFDQQLRTKQLAALVGRRPWWQSWSLAGVWCGLRRYHLPLGAAALVALAVLSIRENQPEPAGASSLLEQENPTAGLVDPERLAPEMVVALASSSARAEVGGQEEASPIAGSEAAPAPARATALSGSVTQLIPLLGAPAEGPSEGAASTLPVYGDAVFGSPVIGETMVGRSLLSSAAQFSRIEARAVTARTAVEPLQQITPPSERRGTRILTAMVSMASVENAMRATERAASRLSEEQLYEQIQRFGARGAGVNVRF